MELDELLGRSDYISVHVPLNGDTRGLIDAAAVARMKPGAVFINTSRGGVVRSCDVLADGLESGRLSAVGLDVFEEEPPDTSHRLFRDRRCLFSPHTAGTSEVAMARIYHSMATSMVKVLNGEAPEYLLRQPGGAADGVGCRGCGRSPSPPPGLPSRPAASFRPNGGLRPVAANGFARSLSVSMVSPPMPPISPVQVRVRPRDGLGGAEGACRPVPEGIVDAHPGVEEALRRFSDFRAFGVAAPRFFTRSQQLRLPFRTDEEAAAAGIHPSCERRVSVCSPPWRSPRRR